MSRSNHRIARILRRLAISLAIFVALLLALYWVAAHYLLNLDRLQRFANRRPERLQMSWSAARSPSFGVLDIDDFRIYGQARAAQWSIEADHVRGSIDLRALFKRRLETSNVSARGLTVRVRRMARPVGAPGKFGGSAPSFPQFAGHPLPPPPTNPVLPVLAAAVPARTGWHFDFPTIDASEIRELWLEEIRYTGSATARGGFRFTLGGQFEVDESSLAFPGGEASRMSLGSEATLSALTGELHGHIDPYRPRDLRGWKVLSQLTAGAQVSARAQGLDLLHDTTGRAAPWLELAGGAAPLTARLEIERGRWRPPTRVEAQPGRVEARVFDYQAIGDGSWFWEIAPGSGTDPETARLAVRIENVAVRRAGFAKPHIQGAQLAFTAETTATEILEPLLALKPKRLDLANAKVPDLTVYNSYLPASTQLRIRSGTATARAHLEPVDDGSEALVGSFELEARRVRATAEETSLRGDFTLRAAFPRLDWSKRNISIAGTRLDLANVEVEVEKGSAAADIAPVARWWAKARVEHGALRPGREPFLEGRFALQLADSRPLIALLEQRRPLPGYIAKALTTDNVQAKGSVRLWTGEMKITDFIAIGGEDKIEFRTHLARRDGQPLRGVFYGRWRKLGIGLEFKNGERDVHLLRPASWFEEQTPP